jgi:transketolase
VRAMLDYKGPVYLRLSRDLVGSCHAGDETFDLRQAKVLRDGTDTTLAVCGTLLPYALEAADELAKRGVSAAVLEFPVIKPFDADTLLRYATKTGQVVSIEEHSILGGLGSTIAECLSENCPSKLRRVGIKDTFGESGDYQSLLDKYGLTTRHIVDAALSLLSASGPGKAGS